MSIDERFKEANKMLIRWSKRAPCPGLSHAVDQAAKRSDAEAGAGQPQQRQFSERRDVAPSRRRSRGTAQGNAVLLAVVAVRVGGRASVDNAHSWRFFWFLLWQRTFFCLRLIWWQTNLNQLMVDVNVLSRKIAELDPLISQLYSAKKQFWSA